MNGNVAKIYCSQILIIRSNLTDQFVFTSIQFIAGVMLLGSVSFCFGWIKSFENDYKNRVENSK